MRKIWVVVANSSTAKIYRAENVNTLVEIHTLNHSVSHLHDRDIVSDKPGRSKDGHHSIEEQTPQQVKERIHFASEIASYLEKGLSDNNLDRVYLISIPQFLGFLRQSLNPQVAKLIHAEIHKDLTHLRPAQLREYLPPVL